MRMCGYARVSTDEERQLDSLEHQMEFFSDFAKQNGHHLVNVYTDEGITGRQLKKRDAFNKMLSDSKLGQGCLTICTKYCRPTHVDSTAQIERNRRDFCQ